MVKEMYREIIKPVSESFNVSIPKEYFGKEVEVIVFPLFDLVSSEKEEVISNPFDPLAFFGAASSSKATIEKYLSDSKQEWE